MTTLTRFSTKELEFLKNDNETQRLLNYKLNMNLPSEDSPFKNSP